MVEAKEAILTARNEWEKEEKERRSDLQKQEHRLQQKEENLDRKTDNIEKKEENLQNKLTELEASREEIETIKAQQRAELERISGLTALGLLAVASLVKGTYNPFIYFRF